MACCPGYGVESGWIPVIAYPQIPSILVRIDAEREGTSTADVVARLNIVEIPVKIECTVLKSRRIAIG